MHEIPIWSFLYGILSVYPFFPLRHVPVMDRLKIPFRRLMLYATIIMLVQGFTYLWLSYNFPFRGAALAWHRKLFMIPYVLLTLAFTRDSKSKTLFMDFFMVGIVMSVIDVSYIVCATWFADSLAIAPHRTDVLVRGGITLALYPPLYLLFKKSLRPIMQIDVLTVWRYMTAIPLVFAIISIITTMEAFDHKISPVILSIRLSVIGGSILVAALLAKVVRQMEQGIKAEEKSKQAEWLLALQGEQYVTLMRNMDQTREARHDLRHHLAAISMMADGKEYDKLREFVEQYSKTVPTDKNMVFCENIAANSVISHYAALCHEESIGKVDIRCTLPSNSGVEDTDLCILLGNLLENAIEGCKTVSPEMRKVKLRCSIHLETLLIAVGNSFDGELHRENGEILSRKRNSKQKGIGLASVATVAEKYNGELRVADKDGWFMVTVELDVSGRTQPFTAPTVIPCTKNF